jgi:hypothetical protein
MTGGIVPLASLNEGDDGMVLIGELLALPYSIDFDEELVQEVAELYPDDTPAWHELAYDENMEDDGYEAVRDSLEECGQQLPLSVCVDNWFAGDLIFGDGHHRLAAMQDLGWSVAWVKHGGERGQRSVVSRDSGSWRDNH